MGNLQVIFGFVWGILYKQHPESIEDWKYAWLKEIAVHGNRFRHLKSVTVANFPVSMEEV